MIIDFFTGCIGNLEGWGLPSPPTPQRKDGAVTLPSAPGAGTVGQPIQGKGRYCQNIGQLPKSYFLLLIHVIIKI